MQTGSRGASRGAAKGASRWASRRTCKGAGKGGGLVRGKLSDMGEVRRCKGEKGDKKHLGRLSRLGAYRK